MVDRRPHRSRPPRWLRRSMSAAVVAGVLSLAHSASAGTTGGSATAQAAGVALVFNTDPPINVAGSTTSLAVGPDTGSQTVPGSLDLEDVASSSSLVATSTSVAVARTPSGVEATSSVDGLQLTLFGETVASVTTIVGGANCPAGESAVTAEAQANGVRLGDAAPVDVSPGQPVRGSITITDEQGQTYPVELVATVFADSEASSGEARGLRLDVTIGDSVPASASLAIASCQRPGGGPEAPAPTEPGGGLADSGSDTAVLAALLGVVLLAGGGSALAWARSRRSPRTDPC